TVASALVAAGDVDSVVASIPGAEGEQLRQRVQARAVVVAKMTNERAAEQHAGTDAGHRSKDHPVRAMNSESPRGRMQGQVDQTSAHRGADDTADGRGGGHRG